MLELNTFLKRVMLRLEEKRKSGAFVFPENYGNKWESNHPAFALVEPTKEHAWKAYRLKLGYSAAESLMSLIEGKYNMVMDCSMALTIAYYVSLLCEMKRLHGEVEGQLRFDTLFGKKDEETPEYCRALISNFGPLCLAPYPLDLDKAEQFKWFQPLAGLFIINKSDKPLENAQLNSLVVFTHGSGVKKYTCFITQQDPIRLSHFGLAAEDCTPDELMRQHSLATDPRFEPFVISFEPLLLGLTLNAPLEMMKHSFYSIFQNQHLFGHQDIEEYLDSLSISPQHAPTPKLMYSSVSANPSSQERKEEPIFGFRKGFLKNGF